MRFHLGKHDAGSSSINANVGVRGEGSEGNRAMASIAPTLTFPKHVERDESRGDACHRPAKPANPLKLRPIGAMLICLVLLAACAGTPTTPSSKSSVTLTATHVSQPTPTLAPTMTPTPTPLVPKYYTTKVLLKGTWRPDDMVFDLQRRILFSDVHNGIIGRLNGDGTVTVLLHDANGLEGLVMLTNGTLIFAEQYLNRIVALAPGAQTPTVLRDLPGAQSSASCKDGVDGIAYAPTTNTIIVPDSPTGDVYSLSLDGKTFKLIATGIVRPVGAAVDGQGNVYVADECGGAVWRITPSGQKTRFGGFGMPDDVAFDLQGNMLVIDLQPAIHALVRMNLSNGQHTVLGSQGFIEPQGLIVDARGNIYVSDDYANTIVEFVPHG
jgi:sugar lactone lactonase YvrE